MSIDFKQRTTLAALVPSASGLLGIVLWTPLQAFDMVLPIAANLLLGMSRVQGLRAFAGYRREILNLAVLLLAVAPVAASARASGPVHPRRLAGDPVGECFAATLDYRGPMADIRVPGTLIPAPTPPPISRDGADSLPPWLCRRPLTDFEAASPRLTEVARAYMALDRALVEFEACFRSGREAMLDTSRRVTSDQCFTISSLPPHLEALADSVDQHRGLVRQARRAALEGGGLTPAERALIEAIHMEVLELGQILARSIPVAHGPRPPPPPTAWSAPRREFVQARQYSPIETLAPIGGEFLRELWLVRWNLDSWLCQLVVVRED